MRKTLKIFGIVVGALVLLIVAAAVIAPMVIQPNDYKDEIAAMVKKRTGRDLTFKGDIGVSVFPWLGLELGGLSLSNAQGFDQGPMLQLDGMDIKVKLLPLLSKDIVIKAVRIHGLNAYLGKAPDGRTNWADLVRAAEAGSSSKDTPAPPDQQQSGGGGFAVKSLAVGEIVVDDSRLTWDDRQLGQFYSLSKLDLGTGEVSLGQPFDFHLSSSFESREPAMRGDISITTHDEPADDYTRHELKDTRIELHATGDALPGGKLDLTMTTDATVDLKERVIHLADLALDALGLSLSGEVRLSGFDTEPRLEASLASKEFNPRRIMAALGADAPATADPEALTRARLGLDLTATQAMAEVRKLDLTLDDSHLTGTARAKDFDKPSIGPNLAFDLSLDSIDVDRYLPPESKRAGDEAAPSGGTAEQPAKTGREGISKETKQQLRALVLDGTLVAGKIKAKGIRLSDTTVRVTAKNGLIKVEPFSTMLYGGALRTVLAADMRTDTTRSALNMKLSNMALGSFLNDLTGKEQVTGQAALNLNLTAVGENVASLRKTLNGEAGFVLKDGAIRGFQIVPNTVREQAAAQSDKVKKAGEVTEQQFRDIKASFKITDGVVRNGDLFLDADNLKASGKGSVNLAESTVDYGVKADITGLPVIPFTIKGSWDDPSYSLDVAEFAKGVAQGLIKAPEKAAKGLLDVGKGALEGLGKGLGGLFGGNKKE